MRPVSILAAAAIFACLLPAQVPIGLGPGTQSPGMIDSFDWYTATASGCTAGARGMCVGGAPVGDTIYFTGWFANASMLPVTTGLPVVGTLNDFNSKTCSGNLMVIQLAAFDWAARNASKIYEVNCMSDYGTAPGAIDLPSGWRGHCTSNDDGGLGCSWKSRSAFVRGGLLYLPVERQIPAGTASTHDATLIVSADGGKTWKNPYTVAHGGAASATGDAPKCGAAATGAGNPCTDPSYPGSIMWPGAPSGLYTWQAVQYGQDGAAPPAGINDGCDPATYACFIGDPTEGTIARVLNTDLPSLDVTKWQYYTCPSITDKYRCPGGSPSSWTSNFAERTPTGPPLGQMWSMPVAYIKEFKSYLMVGGPTLVDGPVIGTAPAIQGPWTIVARTKTAFGWGFDAPALALGYTVVSSDPPRIKLTIAGDTKLHVSSTSPAFALWDLVAGSTPTGESPVPHAGYIMADSHAPGTIPRKDLALAFDMYDSNGVSGGGRGGFHDIANGAYYLTACASEGGCGSFLPTKGTALAAYGADLSYGYNAQLVTMMREAPQTIAIGAASPGTGGLTLENAPAVLQGNGTYTVAGVFRYNTAGYNTVPLWTTGRGGGSDTVALQYSNATGANLSLAWGSVNANRWQYNSGFTLVPGNWYFVACTVQANGSTPLAHMWTGIGGSLVDKIAGVSRTATGGSPAQTPNVAAAPLYMGTQPGDTQTTGASYAGLFVYGRALGQAEVGLIYQTIKAKMLARGLTLQ